MSNTNPQGLEEENKMNTQTEAEKIAYNAGWKAGMRYMMDKKVRT